MGVFIRESIPGKGKRWHQSAPEKERERGEIWVALHRVRLENSVKFSAPAGRTPGHSPRSSSSYLFYLPSPRCCLRFFILRCKLEKTVPETSLWETNDLKLRTTTILVIFFFFKWNVSIGSHDSPRYTIFSRVIRRLSRVCVGNAGFNRVKRDSRSVTS